MAGVRVELIKEAEEDLERYVASGRIQDFLAKLVRIEDHGLDAGQPLGRNLTNWRKIVVGDRNWRIVYTVDPANAVATVCVIGDRDDDQCYKEAQSRLDNFGDKAPQGATLASVMLKIVQADRQAKRQAKKGKKKH